MERADAQAGGQAFGWVCERSPQQVDAWVDGRGKSTAARPHVVPGGYPAHRAIRVGVGPWTATGEGSEDVPLGEGRPCSRNFPWPKKRCRGPVWKTMCVPGAPSLLTHGCRETVHHRGSHLRAISVHVEFSVFRVGTPALGPAVLAALVAQQPGLGPGRTLSL